LSFCYRSPYLGKESDISTKLNNNDVILERRDVPGQVYATTKPVSLLRLGTIGLGFPTAVLAWADMQWKFQAGGRIVDQPGERKAKESFGSIDRAPLNLLTKHRVDLLVIEMVLIKDYQVNAKNPLGIPVWLKMVAKVPTKQRPKVIIECWKGETLFNETEGPTSKRHHTSWKTNGYDTRVQRLEANEVNGAMDQERILVYRTQTDLVLNLKQDHRNCMPGRPMSNFLRFRDIPRKAYADARTLQNLQDGGKHVANAQTECMPRRVGDWIATDKGVRRLLADEYAKGTGVPKTWMLDEKKVTPFHSEHTTCINIWEAVAATLTANLCFNEVKTQATNEIPALKVNDQPHPLKPSTDEPRHTWSWRPTDYGHEGGKWYEDATATLKEVAELSDDPLQVYQEGLITLERCQKSAQDHNLTFSDTSTQARAIQRAASELLDEPERSEWSWRPPDLRVGGPWYQRIVGELRAAANTMEGSDTIFQDGLKILDRHRQNYTATHPEPKQLQILWWMFPAEHWEGLRNGTSMNFLTEPAARIHPNAAMTDEQRGVGGAFVDELISLDAVEECPDDEPLSTSSPLFTLDKPYQPGQYRVISNCREGGQNEVVGSDPVVLPRMNHLLPQLYTGGWSAVVDAAKMFYQFPTRPDERKYLGLIHPITGKHYRYKGLPMGAGNSPAAAARYSAGFVRKLRERFPELFTGRMKENTWRTGWDGAGYDPTKGFGMIWEDPRGEGASLCCPYMDDYFLHAPSYAKLCASLTAYMDVAVDCGFLCHPGKLERPSQQVKYIGYIINTSGTPTLHIPKAKQDKALAMTEKLLATKGEPISALAFSVVAGTLESIVEATPQRQGRCFLRQMYNALHAMPAYHRQRDEGSPELDRSDYLGSGSGTMAEVMAAQGRDQAYAKYYRNIVLPDEVHRELLWWRDLLSSENLCRSAFGALGHILNPMWGDGSGTGTGGTIQIASFEILQWMGAWMPAALPHTSNWKELNTLLLSLQQVQDDPDRCAAVSGTAVFYFTDNEVTYYIAHSGSSRYVPLHNLVMKIKDLERALQVHLEVVHVPGKAMIGQGTDGLSRGIWISPHHSSQPTATYTHSVFDPVHWSPGLTEWAATECGRQELPQLCNWDLAWDQQQVMHSFTLWLPPPPVARQLFGYLLSQWIESPLDTSFVALVPRVMQREWAYLSRYMQRIGAFKWAEVPCSGTANTLPIPVVVLYTAPHRRVLPAHRQRKPPLPAAARWHREQADAMRGLQE
jgi:hypothetical protein